MKAVLRRRVQTEQRTAEMGRRVQRRRLVNDALDPKPAPGEIIKFELN